MTIKCVVNPLFIVGFGLLAVCAGCQSVTYDDATDHVIIQPESAKLNSAYFSPVWLTDDRAAFGYYPEPANNNDSPWDDRIIIVDLVTGEGREVPLPTPPDSCSTTAPVGVGTLRRLPDGNLSFIFKCNYKPAGIKTLLYKWDIENASLQMLYNFESFFDASWHTFAPNQVEFIQAEGKGTSDQLFKASLGDEMERLLPEFQRANRPSWSPDGQWIAFRGTETYPGGNPDEFMTFAEFSELLHYPWDIYVMHADGSELQRILSGLQEPGDVQWVPNSDRLVSFSGDYQETPGIWVVDIETQEVTRIWPQRVAFSWSPDGDQMITFERRGEEGEEEFYPVIIDVPLTQLE